MSEGVIFGVGAVIFAISVYGSVMAGGLALTRAEEHALPLVADEVPDGPVAAALPSIPSSPVVGTETTIDPA